MPGGFYARHGKRMLDLVVAAGLLVFLGPLFAVLAAAIKCDSKGPVFYRQERIGWMGRPFWMRKFRSMFVGAESRGAGVLVLARDPRITRLGRWLRRFSLDELPQILNVLDGSMSLIGPRPGLRYQVEQYDEQQRRRLLVRPGITGWAQIHGRNAIAWDQRIALDLEYVDRLSLSLDLRILWRTLPVAVRGQGRVAAADYWRERARAEPPQPSRPPPPGADDIAHR